MNKGIFIFTLIREFKSNYTEYIILHIRTYEYVIILLNNLYL
jgi:hypothetical protein